MTVVKDSSDELNPPIVTTGAALARPPRTLTALDRLALGVATCGVGYVRIAPGTWGSMVGVGLYLMARLVWPAAFSPRAPHPAFAFLQIAFALIALIGLTVVGIWAATRAEPLLGRKDPGPVVIDEVVGQLITYLFIPANASWPLVVAGFFLFRLFDIWKPYPIRRLEALEAGLGIMADDVLAGVYAATVLALLAALSLSF
jgi:phosphatidylglycerophosphatase A